MQLCVFVCIIPQFWCRKRIRFELKSTLLKWFMYTVYEFIWVFLTFVREITTMSEHCSV